MSGPGTAMTATRNYLYSLHGELAAEGIYVGMVTITAVVKHSAYHQALQSGTVKLELPEGVEIAKADPAELAKQLWYQSQHQGVAEIVYPSH